MEGCDEEKMLRKRPLHRPCPQSLVSLSIPSVTLQFSAPAHSIPIHPAHAHTHTYSTLPCLHMERRGRRKRERRESERESLRRKGGGERECSSMYCGNAEIPCCSRLPQNAYWNTSGHTHSEQLVTVPHHTSTHHNSWMYSTMERE